MKQVFTRSNTFLFAIIFLVAALAFLKIGQHDLHEWDESRNGVNAYEMSLNNDYVNYYYNHSLDTWNAKPPLMIWLIVLSYKLFGYNEFALRLPSIISTIIFFVFSFKLIQLLSDSFKALVGCLILMSCKAILGNHVGLTGDFDALLVMLLTASVYYFIQYYENHHKKAIYYVGILTGLAFYAKGTASLVLIPGFFLYLLARFQEFRPFKDLRVLVAMFVFLLIAGSWIVLVFFFGKTSSQSFYGSSNSLETMFIHDTLRRLTSSDFGEVNNRDFFFFFKVIDARLNLWNYLFYLSLLVGAGALYKKRRSLMSYIKEDDNRLVLLSACLILPLSLTLSFAANPNNWYLAPIFLFVVILIVQNLFYIHAKWKPIRLIVMGLLAFTLIRHAGYIYTLPQATHDALMKNENIRGKEIIVSGELKQDIFLYLEWLNSSICRVDNFSDLAQYRGQLILLNPSQVNKQIVDNLEVISFFEGYCLAKIK